MKGKSVAYGQINTVHEKVKMEKVVLKKIYDGFNQLRIEIVPHISWCSVHKKEEQGAVTSMHIS